MKIKIFALVLVIVLITCGLFACAEPTQTKNTPTPPVDTSAQPTDDPQLLAKGDARGALSTYTANTSSGEGESGLVEGMVFVVEKDGKWYSFPFVNGQLTDGDIFDTAPTAFDGLVLETDESNLANMPENVTIYIPES